MIILLVMLMERVPASLRGELSRWMIEPKTGVFVGKVPASVRDRLWEKVLQGKKFGWVMQVWNANNEQGFSTRSVGLSNKILVDFDGLTLVKEIDLL